MKFERINSILTESITDLLIAQYEHELRNHELYRYFSSWAHVNGFPGATKWFHGQAKEEAAHAKSIYEFLRDSGVTFSLTQIDYKDVEVQKYEDLYRLGLDAEISTTESLNKIFEECGNQKSFIAQEFVNRLLYNQLSEETEARHRLAIVSNGDPLIADHIITDL